MKKYEYKHYKCDYTEEEWETLIYYAKWVRANIETTDDGAIIHAPKFEECAIQTFPYWDIEQAHRELHEKMLPAMAKRDWSEKTGQFDRIWCRICWTEYEEKCDGRDNLVNVILNEMYVGELERLIVELQSGVCRYVEEKQKNH